MERDQFQAAVLEMLKDKCEDQKAMRKTGDRIIQLLEEQNRLLTIFVQPVISLQSQQLARMTSEERKKESRATAATASCSQGLQSTSCWSLMTGAWQSSPTRNAAISWKCWKTAME